MYYLKIQDEFVCSAMRRVLRCSGTPQPDSEKSDLQKQNISPKNTVLFKQRRFSSSDGGSDESASRGSGRRARRTGTTTARGAGGRRHATNELPQGPVQQATEAALNEWFNRPGEQIARALKRRNMREYPQHKPKWPWEPECSSWLHNAVDDALGVFNAKVAQKIATMDC